MRDFDSLKKLLDSKLKEYNRLIFIKEDPVAVPHAFNKKEDIEIAGFFAAIFAWGLRKTIINKCRDLLQRMDNTPHDFLMNHEEKDLKQLSGFVHRTFNDSDLLFYVVRLSELYRIEYGLEGAFLRNHNPGQESVSNAISGFRNHFFYSAEKNSACKRINMFLRWMVRKDEAGVDFGIWKGIRPDQLICPLDVHVARVARYLGLISRTQNDWQTALELTRTLKQFDPKDPVKYDFALFGLGVLDKKAIEYGA